MPKTYVPIKRGKTMRYEQESLEKAVLAVENGLSVRNAAKQFSMPKSTIGDRVAGKHALKTSHGRPPALPTEVESKIASSIKMAAKLGVGLSRRQILIRSNEVYKRMKKGTGYTNFHAGKDRFEGLKRRYPEPVLRKPEKLTSVRARMLNLEVLGKYFDELGKIITEGNFGQYPERLWNCDETSFHMEHTPVRVYAEKGDKSIVSKVSARSSNITVMACVSANGSRMPPMLISKGKTQRSLLGFRTEDAPPESVWTFQKKGWINDEIGEQWFDQVFLKHCGPERPQLLLMDGHGSHETLAIIERAMDENIILMVFPPHCTHYLQPLDRTVFGPLKTAFNHSCSNFLSENPLHLVNKHTFPSLFSQAWNNAVSSTNITNGFRACGIHPLNRRAVPTRAYDPARLTDVPLQSPASLQNSSAAENLHTATDEFYIATPIQSEDIPEATQADSTFESSLPILDIGDPQGLLDLLSGGISVEAPIDHEASTEVTEEVSVTSLINGLFLPPVVNAMPTGNPRRQICTSHKLLTSEEIIEKKRQKIEKKNAKTSKSRCVKSK